MLKRLMWITALSFVVSGVSWSSIDEQLPKEKSFREKLREQEKEEHLKLLDSIKTMSEADYRAYLDEYIKQGYLDNSTSNRAIVIVDTTSETNKPKPNFFVRLFRSPPDEKEFGINKVEHILDNAGKNPSAESLDLKFKKGYLSLDKLKHYQRLEGTFTNKEAAMLIQNNNIIDVHIVDKKHANTNTFVAIHKPTGRILPREKPKQYDREFLNKGYYEDLLNAFKDSETAMVHVGFHLPPNANLSYPTEEILSSRRKVMDNFLAEWSNYEFEVIHKGDLYFLLITTLEHVKALKEDHRVETLQKGSLVNSIRP